MYKLKKVLQKFALIASVFSLALIYAPAAHAQYEGTNGRIYFVGSGDSGQLTSVWYDGSDYFLHGDISPCARFLSISSVSTAMTYVSDAGGDCDVWFGDGEPTAGANATPQNLTSGVTTLAAHPHFSKDGSKIVYLEEDSVTGNGDIWVMNADGSNKIQLTDTIDSAEYPTWSPNNDLIYIYYYTDASNHGILSISPTTTNQSIGDPTVTVVRDDVTMTAGNGMDVDPYGDKIAFSNGGGIYLANVDGTGTPLLVTDPDISYYRPYYSPDGLYLVAYKDATNVIDRSLAKISIGADALLSLPAPVEDIVTNTASSTKVSGTYVRPFWSNVQTNNTPETTPAPPNSSGNAIKKNNGSLSVMLIVIGATLITISAGWFYTDKKRKKS